MTNFQKRSYNLLNYKRQPGLLRTQLELITQHKKKKHNVLLHLVMNTLTSAFALHHNPASNEHRMRRAAGPPIIAGNNARSNMVAC